MYMHIRTHVYAHNPKRALSLHPDLAACPEVWLLACLQYLCLQTWFPTGMAAPPPFHGFGACPNLLNGRKP